MADILDKIKEELNIDPRKKNYAAGRFGNSGVEIKLQRYLLKLIADLEQSPSSKAGEGK